MDAPFHTVCYPDYDDKGDTVLYYAEFFKVNERVVCKVYKRQWFPYAKAPAAEPKTLQDYFTNEVHPFVLFEFTLNENTEPRKQTVEFMVDAMNEKHNKERYENP